MGQRLLQLLRTLPTLNRPAGPLGRRLGVVSTMTACLLALLIIGACGDGATPTRAPTTAPAGPGATPTLTPTTAPAGAKEGRTLTIAQNTDVTTLDPQNSIFQEDNIVWSSLFDGILDEDLDGTNIAELAESWSVSNDGQEYTFNLRRGVKFHDGCDFNAQAAETNILRQQNKTHSFRFGSYDFNVRRIFDGVEVLGDNTIKYKISQQQPFLDFMTMQAGLQWSPCALEQYGDNAERMATQPTGTGPFKFVEWRKDVRVVLERNPDYWGEKALLDRIVLVPISEESTRVANLKAGIVDAIFEPQLSPENVGTFERDPNFYVQRTRYFHVWYLMLIPANSEPLQDRRVRQAMALAINKEAIVKDLLAGSAEVAHTQLWPKVYGEFADPSIVTPYDPDRSRQLLREASYADGFDVTAVGVGAGTGYLYPRSMMTAIQSDLAKVGITLNIQIIESAQFGPRAYAAPHSDFQMGWESWRSVFSDPWNKTWLWYHSTSAGSGNYSGYSNPEMDRLLELQRTQVTSPSERAQTIHQILRLGTDEMLNIPIAHGFYTVIANNKVKDVVVPPNLHHRLKDILVE